MSIERNKEIALRLAIDGWGTASGWEQVWDELVATDVVQYFCSSSNSIQGLAAVKAFESDLFQGFPQLEQTISHVIAEDDYVVYFHTLKGKNTGVFMDIPPSNKDVKVTGFTMLRLNSGKVVERWYETNLLAVLQQIGVIPQDI
ncbi:MAG: ester cyclase [Cyanobacteria bacterium J06623_7]